MTGKEKCRELRQIRRQIAEQNSIDLPLEDCTYEGPCEGTCPKCEEELRSLEAALNERKKAGLDVKLKGIASDAAEKWNAPKDPFSVPESDVPSPIPGEGDIPELAGAPTNIIDEDIMGLGGPSTIINDFRNPYTDLWEKDFDF